MAKILCAYSGIEFTCEHFPVSLYARESFHPIFTIPQRKLLTFLPKWASSELTRTDSYLLFLAYLHSTELIEFRVPCAPNPLMHSIVAQNMEFLVKTIIKLNTVSNPGVVFPRYAITAETKFLSNVHFWIENWHVAYEEFRTGKIKDYENRQLVQRECALERMIKNPHKKDSEIAHHIAEWAAEAGEFPQSMTSSPWTQGKQITIEEYWKELICKSARKEFMGKSFIADMEELLEHCETNIDAIGSIYSHKLFEILRSSVQRQRNWLGLGDGDLKHGIFSLLDESSTTETANMQALIDSAPEEEPLRHMYEKTFDFMKAKMRWNMAKKAGKR